jgi:hypothetical protein
MPLLTVKVRKTFQLLILYLISRAWNCGSIGQTSSFFFQRPLLVVSFSSLSVETLSLQMKHKGPGPWNLLSLSL